MSDELPGPEELPGPWRWGLGEVGEGYGMLPFEHREDEDLHGSVEWDTGWDSILVLVERVTERDENGDPDSYERLHRSTYDEPKDVTAALPDVLAGINQEVGT